VCDVAQDFYSDECLDVFENARKGAFKTLDRLQDTEAIECPSGIMLFSGRAFAA
jgi:D-threo-aldose 1-dehydrogenase